MRRKQSNKIELTTYGYKKSIWQGIKRFVILVLIYTGLLVPVWHGDIAAEVPNHLLLFTATVYSGYYLWQGQNWELVYLTSAIYAAFLWAPRHFEWLLNTAIDAMQAQPVAAFAALFAYVGWREASMTTQVQHEEALRNRLEGWERESKGVQVSISRVRVTEASGMPYKFLRYFALVGFHGITFLRLSIQSDTDLKTSQVMDSLGLTRTHITDFYELDTGEYKLRTKTTALDAVESEFERLLDTIDRHNRITQAPSYTGKTELALGKATQPHVEYFLPKGVLRGLVVQNEFSKIKSIEAESNISIEYGLQRELGVASGAGSAPMTCVYEENSGEIEYYRTYRHLFKTNLPSWLLPNRLYKPSNLLFSTPKKYQPMYKGLESLESCFANIDIKGISDATYEDGNEYEYIEIEDKNLNIYPNRFHIPVTNYRPPGDTEMTTGRQTTQFNAKQVRYDPNPDKGHGKLSAVYGHMPVYYEVSWPDTNKKNFIEAEITVKKIKGTPYTDSQQYVIWKREELSST